MHQIWLNVERRWLKFELRWLLAARAGTGIGHKLAKIYALAWLHTVFFRRAVVLLWKCCAWLWASGEAMGFCVYAQANLLVFHPRQHSRYLRSKLRLVWLRCERAAVAAALHQLTRLHRHWLLIIERLVEQAWLRMQPTLNPIDEARAKALVSDFRGWVADQLTQVESIASIGSEKNTNKQGGDGARGNRN
jgi:hypothetical protein